MKHLLLSFLLLLTMAHAAPAAVQNIRVLAVGVDSSSVRAQEKALDYAKKRAVYLVARKWMVPNPSDTIAALKEEQFHEIVRGAEIVQIRRAGERTYADVMVSVLDKPLKRALGMPEGEAPDPAEAEAKGVLVLPVYVKNSRPYVWEKDNGLREPLSDEVLRQSHGVVLMPSGDLDDLRLIDYRNVLSVTGKELGPMFTRYGVDEVVIAIFTPGTTAEKARDATILLRRLTPTTNRTEKLQFVPPLKLDAISQLHTAATQIAGAVTQISASTSANDQKRLEKATKLPVLFRYANPRELATMQERLRSQREVLLLELPAIALGDLRGVAYVEGDTQKLREKLTKSGIIITNAGDGWQLSLR